jgi:peptide-methionine (R)-S-oxide reductase
VPAVRIRIGGTTNGRRGNFSGPGKIRSTRTGVAMKRREALRGLLAGGLLGTLSARVRAAQAADMSAVKMLQESWMTLLPEGLKVPKPTEHLELSKEAWQKRLDKMQFYVLRDEGTERAGTSPLNDEKRPGVFACAGCGLPLFTSEMKYDSGTGWPSFFTTVPDALLTKTDYKLILPRTEYHCARCGGHQGHVFNDGPPPTGQRWCNNGVALKFIPKTANG